MQLFLGKIYLIQIPIALFEIVEVIWT